MNKSPGITTARIWFACDIGFASSLALTMKPNNVMGVFLQPSYRRVGSTMPTPNWTITGSIEDEPYSLAPPLDGGLMQSGKTSPSGSHDPQQALPKTKSTDRLYSGNLAMRYGGVEDSIQADAVSPAI